MRIKEINLEQRARERLKDSELLELILYNFGRRHVYSFCGKSPEKMTEEELIRYVDKYQNPKTMYSTESKRGYAEMKNDIDKLKKQLTDATKRIERLEG